MSEARVSFPRNFLVNLREITKARVLFPRKAHVKLRGNSKTRVFILRGNSKARVFRLRGLYDDFCLRGINESRILYFLILSLFPRYFTRKLHGLRLNP